MSNNSNKVEITLPDLVALYEHSKRIGTLDSYFKMFAEWGAHADKEIARLTKLAEKRAIPDIDDDSDSVVLPWVATLSLQQQSMMLLALRGPDGSVKETPVKRILRAYRPSIIKAAKYGRELKLGEKGDRFMSFVEIIEEGTWDHILHEFTEWYDSANMHYFTHLIYGAEILAYKHPAPIIRERWHRFYIMCVTECMHFKPESEAEMDARLNDWGKEYWNL